APRLGHSRARERRDHAAPARARHRHRSGEPRSGADRRAREKPRRAELRHRLGPREGPHHVRVGIRASALRKVYTSPPPVAGGARAFGAPGGRLKKKTKAAYEVVALDGLTLE